MFHFIPHYPNRSVICSMKCCYSRIQFQKREDVGSCGCDVVSTRYHTPKPDSSVN